MNKNSFFLAIGLMMSISAFTQENVVWERHGSESTDTTEFIGTINTHLTDWNAGSNCYNLPDLGRWLAVGQYQYIEDYWSYIDEWTHPLSFFLTRPSKK